jgi:hypothetical protein
VSHVSSRSSYMHPSPPLLEIPLPQPLIATGAHTDCSPFTGSHFCIPAPSSFPSAHQTLMLLSSMQNSKHTFSKTGNANQLSPSASSTSSPHGSMHLAAMTRSVVSIPCLSLPPYSKTVENVDIPCRRVSIPEQPCHAAPGCLAVLHFQYNAQVSVPVEHGRASFSDSSHVWRNSTTRWFTPVARLSHFLIHGVDPC